MPEYIVDKIENQVSYQGVYTDDAMVLVVLFIYQNSPNNASRDFYFTVSLGV